MGCCSSIPTHEEEISQQQAEVVTEQNTKNTTEKDAKISNVKGRDSTTSNSSSFQINNNKEKSPISSEAQSWPVLVRLSNNGQDITIQVPTEPPYLTVAGLREALLPHLEKNSRVRLIYLGRILPDQHMIVPTETDDDIPLPPPKKRTVLIQKEGVIQAMITKL